MPEPRLVLVGNPDIVHVGAHFHRAALDSGWAVSLLDSEEAFQGPALVARLNWWVRGRRPTHLQKFSEKVLQTCREFQPDFLLATGIAPIAADAVRSIGALGIHRLNYLTDDPWNPHHQAPWFMDSLSNYDHVFSPRRANLEDLRGLAGPSVFYLPFAYAPEVHFPDPPANKEESLRFASDVVFAGGADSDRVCYADALIREGFRIALYGRYWDRYLTTRRFALGPADPHTLRKAIGGSKVALCLVRRANRDGHSMRTFELAASGACILAEDTVEHREILGDDREAAIYFRTIPEMVEKLRWLLEHPDARRRLAAASRRRVVTGANTYADRLAVMAGVAVAAR